MEELRAFAKNWLPLLFNAFVGARAGERGHIGAAISAYAVLCEPAFLASFFRAVVSKLIKAQPAPTLSLQTGGLSWSHKSSRELGAQSLSAQAVAAKVLTVLLLIFSTKILTCSSMRAAGLAGSIESDRGRLSSCTSIWPSSPSYAQLICGCSGFRVYDLGLLRFVT